MRTHRVNIGGRQRVQFAIENGILVLQTAIFPAARANKELSARPVAQHRPPARRRTVLALLRHDYLPYSVASDAKLLETSHGLGTGGPARRAMRAAAGDLRGGE